MAAFTGIWCRNLLQCADDVVAIRSGDGASQYMAIQLAQQEEQVKTATASSSIKADACSLSTDKAFNLCIIQGLNSIKRVTCECTESGPRAAPKWECVGTVVCQ